MFNLNVETLISFYPPIKLHLQSLLLPIPAQHGCWIHSAHTLSLHFTISCRYLQYVQSLQYGFFSLCFLKLCSKLPPISASAWCSGNNILLTRCSPTSYQYKQQAHSLPNESPSELTLLPVVLMPSRCFSLCPSASQVYSPTQLPIQQQLLIASLKILWII